MAGTPPSMSSRSGAVSRRKAMLTTAAALGVAGAGPLLPAARAAAPALRAVPGLAEGFYALGNGRIAYVDEHGFSLLSAGSEPEPRGRQPLSAGSDFDGLVARLLKQRQVWAIEHAAVLRLATERQVALLLLRAAIRADLVSAAPATAALRLYDLGALVSGPALGELCSDISACGMLPDPLRLRLERWQDPMSGWNRKRIVGAHWKSAASDGSVLVTPIGRA
ncbi:MAG: hypothetical protein ABIO40_07115 [Devosia sp.]